MYMLLGLLFLYQCNLSTPQTEDKNPVCKPIENHQEWQGLILHLDVFGA